MKANQDSFNLDFDSWLSFYNENEEWIDKSILFLRSRLPFDVDRTLMMLASETDKLKRSGMWTAFEEPMMVHVGIVLKFQMVTADMPLLSNRLQVLNALVANNKSHDLDYIIDSQKNALKVEQSEKIHVLHYLNMAKEWCEKTGTSYDKFCQVNAAMLMCFVKS